jgi:DNA-binding NarL/FixJ family response regulator
VSTLHEEQVFLTEMMVDQRVAAVLEASGVARAVRRRLLESRPTGATRAARATLTRQELMVLMMLTEGASNKGIARGLGLSEPTVKFHLKNLFRKLNVSRRAEAVATARSLGWLR